METFWGVWDRFCGWPEFTILIFFRVENYRPLLRFANLQQTDAPGSCLPRHSTWHCLNCILVSISCLTDSFIPPKLHPQRCTQLTFTESQLFTTNLTSPVNLYNYAISSQCHSHRWSNSIIRTNLNRTNVSSDNADESSI